MDRPIRIEIPPTRFAYKLKFPIIALMFKARNSMAPKGSKKKRSIQLSKARESKRRKSDDEESNLSDDLDDEIPTFMTRMKMKLTTLQWRSLMKMLLWKYIQNYFRMVRHYMFAYVEGFKGGPDMEKQIKKYRKLLQVPQKGWRQ